MSSPTCYTPDLVPVARTLAERGALDRDLAIAFGVPFGTIREWKQRHPHFAAACRLPPDAADEAVERALFRKATGYDRETERVILENGTLVRTMVTEHVPPCDKAATFWLRVRRPDRWGPPPPVMRSASALSPVEETLRDIEGDAFEAYCDASEGEPEREGDEDALARIDALAPHVATPADDADPLQNLETVSPFPSSQRKLGSLSTATRSHAESDPSLRRDDGRDGRPPKRDTLPHPYKGPLPAFTEAIVVEPVDADPSPVAAPHYDPAFIPLALELAGQGALESDIARAFGVSTTTLRQWTLRHAIFGAAVRLGERTADEAVEQALFARATGYSYIRETRLLADDGSMIRAEITAEQPPSLTAALFWLGRRRSDRWSRHRQPGRHPAEVARLIAETRERVAEYDLHRRHWRDHGCAPPGREEPAPPLWRGCEDGFGGGPVTFRHPDESQDPFALP